MVIFGKKYLVIFVLEQVTWGLFLVIQHFYVIIENTSISHYSILYRGDLKYKLFSQAKQSKPHLVIWYEV